MRQLQHVHECRQSDVVLADEAAALAQRIEVDSTALMALRTKLGGGRFSYLGQSPATKGCAVLQRVLADNDATKIGVVNEREYLAAQRSNAVWKAFAEQLQGRPVTATPSGAAAPLKTEMA